MALHPIFGIVPILSTHINHFHLCLYVWLKIYDTQSFTSFQVTVIALKLFLLDFFSNVFFFIFPACVFSVSKKKYFQVRQKIYYFHIQLRYHQNHTEGPTCGEQEASRWRRYRCCVDDDVVVTCQVRVADMKREGKRLPRKKTTRTQFILVTSRARIRFRAATRMSRRRFPPTGTCYTGALKRSALPCIDI